METKQYRAYYYTKETDKPKIASRDFTADDVKWEETCVAFYIKGKHEATVHWKNVLAVACLSAIGAVFGERAHTITLSFDGRESDVIFKKVQEKVPRIKNGIDPRIMLMENGTKNAEIREDVILKELIA